MFTDDPKLNPHLPSLTSFHGVKPSYEEWSEKLLTYLSVTDYQELVPIPQVVTGHNYVITKKGLHRGCLVRARRSDQEQEDRERRSSVRCQWSCWSRSSRSCSSRDRWTQWKKNVKGVNTHESRQLSQVCSASLNIRWPQHHGSSHHENIKLRLRCSHWSRNLASNGCHLCRFSSNSSSHTPQADHVTHRIPKINKRPSKRIITGSNSSASTRHSAQNE